MRRGHTLNSEMRKKIPAAIERALQVYFCDTRLTSGSVECVVTSKRDYTWHHLNHRKSDNRLSNIVPLIQNLNKNLDIAKNNAEYLDPLLECNHLERVAQTAFWLEGQVARAFGCTRIGYYVAHYKKYSFSEGTEFWLLTTMSRCARCWPSILSQRDCMPKWFKTAKPD